MMSLFIFGNATSLVKLLHNTPRLVARPGFLNFRWIKALPFNPTDTSEGGYWESIIITSLLPAILGISVLLLLSLWAYCRAICCCKTTSRRKLRDSYKCHVRVMYFFLVGTILIASLGFLGDIAVDTGFADIENGVINVTNLLTPAKNIAIKTSVLDDGMLKNLHNVKSCPWPQADKELGEMKIEATHFGHSLDDIAISTKNTISFILNLDINSFLNKYALDRRIVFGLPLAFILVIGAITYIATSCIRSKYMLRFTFICLTPLCILILLFAASFEIGASLTLSDICIDPQKVALTLASSPQDLKQHFTISDNDSHGLIYDEVKYYLTCTGTNPIRDKVIKANNTILGFQLKLNVWVEFCDPDKADPAVTNLINELESAIDQLNQVNTLIECKAINDIWNNVVRGGLCDSAISGFTILSITQTFSTFPWLFLCTIAASFVWRRIPYLPNENERRRLSNLLEDAGINDGDHYDDDNNNNNNNMNNGLTPYELLLDNDDNLGPINNSRNITDYESIYVNNESRTRREQVENDDVVVPIATNVVAIQENGQWY